MEEEQLNNAEINQNKTFSISKIFNRSWETYKKNFGFLIALSFAYVGILIVTSVLGTIFEKNEVTNLLLQLIFVIVDIILSIGLIQIFLKISRGNKASVKELFGGRKYLLNYFLGWLLYSIICLVGFILFIIPGIIWGIKYSLYPYLVIDKEMGPVEALKESGKITYGYKWNLFFLTMLSLLMIFAGALLLGIGLFVAVPMSFLIATFAYRFLANDEIENSSEMPEQVSQVS